jgi:small nuclear ribonucleoprotein (snRNP)-like protein
MKNAFRHALLLAAATLPLTGQDSEVLCTDGSRIRGSLTGVETDRLVFDADFLEAPVPLRLEKVLQVSMPIHRGDPQGDHVATLELTNGDIVRGELTGIDDSTIKVRTWYAGELSFRRTMVDRLEIQDRPEVLFAGPSGLDGWTQTEENSWTFEHGWLRSRGPGGIARKVEIPQRVRYAFDVSWRSNPRFRFIFASSDIQADSPENCYVLVCQGRYVQLHKRWAKGNRSGETPLGIYANVPEFLNKERCRIELLLDRKSGQIRLVVDGRVAQDWTDGEADSIHGGDGMHFNTQDGTPFRVSRIEVTTWDGILEGKPPEQDEGFLNEEDTPEPEPEQPMDPSRIRLRNNDQIAGKLLGIDDGRIRVEAPFGEMKLPVSRLRTFLLHTDEERENPDLGLWEKPIRRNGDIRAWFPDGGHITFRLLATGNGKLEGDSQTFGKASFDMTAFSRLEFNIHEVELDERRESAEAW